MNGGRRRAEGSSGFDVAGRRVVVVGAARSGVAAALALARRGASVVVSERAPSATEAGALTAAGVELELGGHRTETFTRADLVVVSPGVKLHIPVLEATRAAGVEVIGELELASRWIRGRVVAITGTKGKSTTTTLVGRMLDAAGVRVLTGGNIGVPLASQVEESRPDTVHVVEASSFQLEATSRFHADVAVFLNFSPDHLDQHASIEEYREAKARIFETQRADDVAVVNADDPEVMALAARTTARLVRFAAARELDEGVFVRGDAIVSREGGRETVWFHRRDVEVAGRHMLANVVAAAAAAHAMGASPAAMVEGLKGFQGLEHAMEPLREVGGVRFVNDSKATNVDAARYAIESVPGGAVVILGGKFKGGDLGVLREALREHARAAVLIGEAAPMMAEAFAGAVVVERAASMADAVRRAYALARPAGTVVLAPACSSFDMFADYGDRGRQFKEEVARLGAAHDGES